MGNIHDFSIELDKQLHRVIPEEMREDLEIEKVEIVKVNDQKLHGLVFRTKGLDAAPTFYIDDFYGDYKEGWRSAADIAEELFWQYQQAEYISPPQIAREFDFSFDNIKDRLSIRVLDPGRNKEYLADKPYHEVDGGLVAMMDYNPASDWRIAINNDILEKIGVDKETLYEAAVQSMLRIDAPVLTDMTNALFSPERVNLLDMEEPVAPEDRGGMYVLTADSGNCGAAFAAVPDITRKSAEVIGTSCYVLPSSLHEVILVPDEQGIDVKDLHNMVMTANRSVVELKDILSDDVFYYDLHEHSFRNLTADVEHEAEETYDDDLDM